LLILNLLNLKQAKYLKHKKPQLMLGFFLFLELLEILPQDPRSKPQFIKKKGLRQNFFFNFGNTKIKFKQK
jgi:hypothetical protein